MQSLESWRSYTFITPCNVTYHVASIFSYCWIEYVDLFLFSLTEKDQWKLWNSQFHFRKSTSTSNSTNKIRTFFVEFRFVNSAFANTLLWILFYFHHRLYLFSQMIVFSTDYSSEFQIIVSVENRVREVPISLYRVTVLTGKVPCRLLLMKS